MKLKILFVFVFSYMLMGCFAYVNPILQIPQHAKSTSFQVGQEQQANLGEPMVTEEDLFFYDGLEAAEDFQLPSSYGATYPLIKRGTMFRLFAHLNNGDKAYELLGEEGKIKARGLYGEPVQWNYCIAVNQEGRAYGISACTMDYVTKWAEPAPVNFLKKAKVYDKGSFKMELIYSGKSKDTIKLSYREFKDNLARVAFTQELSYDLSESKMIGFKKMQIKVIEATNSYIKFIVHSSIQ